MQYFGENGGIGSGGGGLNIENAGSEKQKKITKIVLFISGFILILMIVGSLLLGD
jgi:hypothetical protein